MISLTLRVRCIVAIAAALVPISWAFGQAPGTGGDRNYPALTYRSPSNIENILDVVTIGGKTYLVDRQFDGKLNGMMQRVFADRTVQFEEWESGRLLQVGLRGPFSSTIAPQSQARGAPATRSGAPETGAVAPAADTDSATKLVQACKAELKGMHGDNEKFDLPVVTHHRDLVNTLVPRDMGVTPSSPNYGDALRRWGDGRYSRAAQGGSAGTDYFLACLARNMAAQLNKPKRP